MVARMHAYNGLRDRPAVAIAEATEPNRKPKSFPAKYTPPFARLYRSLCEEIIQRSQWQAAESHEQVAVPV